MKAIKAIDGSDVVVGDIVVDALGKAWAFQGVGLEPMENSPNGGYFSGRVLLHGTAGERAVLYPPMVGLTIVAD